MAVYLRAGDNGYTIGKTIRTHLDNNIITLHDNDYKNKYVNIKHAFNECFENDGLNYLGKLLDILITFISVFFTGKNILNYISKRKLLAIACIAIVAAITIAIIIAYR